MPHSPRRAALSLIATTATAAAMLLTGCGIDLPTGGEGSARDRAEGIVEEIRRAVEEAKERNAEESGELDQPAPGTGGVPADGEVIRTDTRTAFVYEEYQATLESVIVSLEAYWSRALPDSFQVKYSGPSRYVYYRPEEQPGPPCEDQPAPPRNALYCPAGDFIAWDESGLMIPYYVSAGDFAAAFVLAHEFGHAMQARLPRQEGFGVLVELQADCFAGAWARDVQDQGLLEAGDLDEATLAVFSARDVPGTAFTDPRAHGSGFERTRAFADGYESGPTQCYPAPADAWIVAP
jgi:predicted metalloprotease